MAPARIGPTLDEMIAAQAERFARAHGHPGARPRDPVVFADSTNRSRRRRARLWYWRIGRGDIVASVLPSGPDAATALVSVASCATFAPLNPSCGDRSLKVCLRTWRLRSCWRSPASAQSARKAALVGRIPVVDVVPELRGGRLHTAGRPCRGKKRANRWASSGARYCLHPFHVRHHRPSEAGARHPSRSVRGNRCLSKVYDLTEQDCCLSFSALFHALGLASGLLLPLWSGGKVVLTNGFRAEAFAQWLSEYEPTWFSAVPTVLQEILDHAVRRPDIVERSSIRFIRSAGAALPVSLADGLESVFKAPLLQTYGMSELIGVSTDTVSTRRRGSCGRPLCNEVAVMDHEGRVLPTGSDGEVVVRGPSVGDGYFRNPEATQAAYRDGWFHTRDIGYLDEDGFLFLTGRASEFINRGGEKISPLEVDQVSGHTPRRRQGRHLFDTARQTRRRYGGRGGAPRRRVGHCSPTTGIRFPAIWPRTSCRAQIFFLDKLPVGPTGKVLRSKMREHTTALASQAEKAPVPFVKPRDDRERRIAEIWSRVLRLDRVGIHDDFFALGGDSLAATECTLLLEEEFGLDLALARRFPLGAQCRPARRDHRRSLSPRAALRRHPASSRRRRYSVVSDRAGRRRPTDRAAPGNESPLLRYPDSAFRRSLRAALHRTDGRGVQSRPAALPARGSICAYRMVRARSHRARNGASARAAGLRGFLRSVVGCPQFLSPSAERSAPGLGQVIGAACGKSLSQPATGRGLC